MRAERGQYEVIVVGAGHAGCEAALAAARMGRRTLLLTMSLDLVAHMPCNPSIGGPGKSHLVREVDALGGAMARVADRTTIQIRMLNASRGPAVQALRAQVDRRLYVLAMLRLLESVPNLDVRQGRVEGLELAGDRIGGVRLADGARVQGDTLVLATGTFLNGAILGEREAEPAGRAGEFPALGLAQALRALGLSLGRLQTNTPPRVDARSVDWRLTDPQYGSDSPLYLSLDGPPADILCQPIHPVYPIVRQSDWRAQLPCYLVHTNAETHRVVRENLHRSPVVSGTCTAAGPRYCPSLEEKVVRFGHKDAHALFLEPEGYATTEVYVQGCFTGMPVDVQEEMLHTIPALRRARIVRAGYAIAYDHVPAHQIRPTLETRAVRGLYLAGQINGTSGYEEAAAQGLLAGANAALAARDEPPLVLGRDEAYLGVLVDDLITKDQAEPYRMMTSRAEYRLLLRQDNADLRLAEVGRRVGLLSAAQVARAEARRRAIESEIARLDHTSLIPNEGLSQALARRGQPPVTGPISARQLLRRPGMEYAVIEEVAPPPEPLSGDTVAQVEVEVRYEGYIEKQRRQVARAARLEMRSLPEDLDYSSLSGLRAEACERLAQRRPATIGQASRLAGVNPADISVLLIHLEQGRREMTRPGGEGGVALPQDAGEEEQVVL